MGVYRREDKLRNGKTRKGKIWWICYVVAGRQVRESSHSTNKRVARNLLAIRQAQVLEGRMQLPKSKPPKFEEWAKKVLGEVPHPSTKERYTYSTDHLLARFKGARLNQITADSIEEFKQERLAEGVRGATVNRDLAVLRRMLTLAKKRRLIGQNPFGEVEFLEERKQRRQPHILTFEEQERLVAAAAPRLRVLVVLLTETGLRVNKEALQLRWEDIDLKDSTLRVRDSKTPAGKRVVPLSSLCKAELERWKNLTGPEFSEFVFPRFSNPRHPLYGSGRKAWRTALKKEGLPHFPIYDLRHTFATRLHAAGESPLTVAQMLGHSSTAIVSTYAKTLEEHLRGAIRKLEEYRQGHFEQTTASSLEERSLTDKRLN
jgi:integrase